MITYLLYISENYSFKVLRPLQEEILKRGDKAKWFIEGKNININYFKEDEIVLKNIQEVIKYNPDVVLVPGNFVPSFISGLKVEVFHGFMSDKRRKRDNKLYHLIIRDCFDLYCTHGPSTTVPFQNLAKQHKTFDVVETGYCQMDPYFNKKNNKPTKDRPIILFSSTFSPRMTKAPALFETIKELSKNTKWLWQVTFHPKMDKKIVEQYKSIQHDNLQFIETDNLIPYMKNADLMLADFSSMLIDFILLNKPVVTFQNHNKLNYIININDTKELESAIKKGLSRPDYLMKEISKFSSFTHPYTDGKSSLRVLDAIEDKLNSKKKLKKKPLNFIRNLKARKEFNYWKW
jgi:CDP-glycerol glycerophosphotransferase (TagB/SpsB family)